MNTKRKAGFDSKTIRILLALMLLLGLIPATAAMSPDKAFAADTQIFHKENVGNPVNWGGFANFAESGAPAWCADPGLSDADTGGTSYTYAGSGGLAWDYLVAKGYPSTTIEGYSLSVAEAIGATHGAGWLLGSGGDYAPAGMSPDGQAAAFALYNAAISYRGGDPSIDGCSAIWKGPAGYQRLATRVDKGDISLQKESAIPSLTEGNGCYSLENAVYGVYSDRACTNQVETITTDSDGFGKTGKLLMGTYFVKEKTAPNGYALDGTVYEVKVLPGQTAKVNGSKVYDMPQSDPSQMWVGKIDLETTLNMPQGSASLANAHFEIKYYGGYYSTTDLSWIDSTEPTRTWVTKTDEDGRSLLSANYLVSGDEFYYYNNHVTIPLGTVTVQEVKAPEGYLLDDPTIYVQQVTTTGFMETVEVYNAPTIKEQVMRGSLELVKYIEETPDEEGQPEVKVPASGVEFEIVNANEGSVLRADGTSAAKGDVVASITTDEQGWAGLPEGSLVYGTYIVREVASTTPEGHDTVQPFKAVVSEEGKTYRYIIEDKITLSPVKVVKVDGETGRQIPAFVTYQLLDEDKEPVTFVTHYPSTVFHDEFTAAEDGTLTFPEKLAAGKYYLKEVKAPEGYALSDKFVEFTVDESTVWGDPLEVEFENAPIKGEIEIVKRDEATGESVSGAEYSIRAVEDIVTGDGTIRANAGDLVASGIVTDDQGKAFVDGLYLGLYKVYESKAPEGYALDTSEHYVEVVSQGQEKPLVKMRLDVADSPTTVKLMKVDAVSGEALQGAKFRIWQSEAEEVLTFDVGALPKLIERSLVLKNPQIDSVAINEIESVMDRLNGAAAGETIEFRATASLRGDGEKAGYASEAISKLESLFSTYSLKAVFNDDKSISVYSDAGAELCTVEALRTKNDQALDFVGVTDDEGVISLPYLKHGNYKVIEVEAPEGYFLPEDLEPIEFTVDQQGMINGKATYSVKFENDYTKVHISKVDIATGEEVEGATLTITDSDGEVVAEFVTGKELFIIERLPAGVYALTEKMAPATYEYAQSIEFEILPVGTVQTVVMHDEPIEISGEIDKRQTIAGEESEYSYTIDYRSTSSTWADELNVVDPLDSVSAGLTRLSSVVTPVSFEDYDGKLVVFFQTNLTEGKDASEYHKLDEGENPDPLAANPENDWNPDSESMRDWSAWEPWAVVSSVKAETLNVSDLELSDGEYVTSIGFAHGRVERGFATRIADWDREGLKSEHDNIEDTTYPHVETFDLAEAQGLTKADSPSVTHYAPVVLNMEIISEDYHNGNAELWNSAEMDIWRNKGLVPDKLHDDDRDSVVQTAAADDSGYEKGRYDKTGDLGGIVASAGAALVLAAIAGASVFALRRRSGEKDHEAGEID